MNLRSAIQNGCKLKLAAASLCAYFVAVLFCGPVQADEPVGAGDFAPMFNGQDLSGWVQVNTAPSTWSFEDGMVVCTGKPIGEIRTEKMYQNFVMEIEWRHMVPGGNAGIFIWADDITAKGQPFHRGIEVQVLENAYGNTQGHTTHGDIFPIHGATMKPVNGRDGSRAFPTESLSKPSPEWNHYKITGVDGDISLEVNGKLVTQGKECNPKKGYICLESEGGVVHYRNAKIKELPSTPIDSDHIAISNRGYRCLYNGLDFSGWVIPDAAEASWKSRDWVFSHQAESNSDIPGNKIKTAESFGDVGFILDIRLPKESRGVRILPRGVKEGAFEISADNPELIGKLAGNGGWNRLEATLQGNRLTVVVNEHSFITDRKIERLPSSGPLAIEAFGNADFANPYVRQLRGE